MTMTDGLLDEAYERLHRSGPELLNGLTNHAPMVVECLAELGQGAQLHRWLDGYVDELDAAPRGRPIDQWRGALGDSRRIGDWLEHLRRDERPWEELLATWWPRLAPGMAAAATHGVIRTGHAVRALRQGDTAPRQDELRHALAYWAALWSPVPALVPTGHRTPRDALPAVPTLPDEHGRAMQRIGRLADLDGWAASVTALAPVRSPEQVLNDVVDAAVRSYAGRAHRNPVMLVHSVTAPAAVALALPSLPPDQHQRTVELAWTTSAAVVAAYAAPKASPPHAPARTREDAVEQAVRHGDAHAIKLTEAALRAQDDRAARQAAAAAVALITDD